MLRRLGLVIFAAGCSRTVPEETDLVECTETATTPLAIDEASPLGFSGADLAELVGGYPLATGRWSVVDETAQVQIHSQDFESGATYHERAYTDGTTDENCQNTYVPEVGGTDMWVPGSLQATSLDEATLTATISGDEGRVADEVSGMVADEYENIMFTLQNDWVFSVGVDPTISGTLSVEGTKIADGQSYSAVLLTWPG
jgi:hypothetical protein